MTRQRSPPEKSNVTGSRIHICDLIKNTKSKHETGSDLMEAIFLISSQTLSFVGTGYTEHLQDGAGEAQADCFCTEFKSPRIIYTVDTGT